MTCGMCDKTDGRCYTSNPPQVKCTITGEFHYYDDSCSCRREAMEKSSGIELKGCPLLVQSDTNPSYTIEGESHTRTYFLRCIGEKCSAYKKEDCFCEIFHCSVALKAGE